MLSTKLGAMGSNGPWMYRDEWGIWVKLSVGTRECRITCRLGGPCFVKLVQADDRQADRPTAGGVDVGDLRKQALCCRFVDTRERGDGNECEAFVCAECGDGRGGSESFENAGLRVVGEVVVEVLEDAQVARALRPHSPKVEDEVRHRVGNERDVVGRAVEIGSKQLVGPLVGYVDYHSVSSS